MLNGYCICISFGIKFIPYYLSETIISCENLGFQ